MHEEIRANASRAGFTEADGTLLIVACGAEETRLVTSALGGAHTVDTVVSVLTLCGVPAPRAAMRGLADEVLRPGGLLLFWEHVLSRRADVAWWQRFWTPLWKRAFDGCRLDRPTDVWVMQMDAWAESKVWTVDGDLGERLLWHQIGRFVKKGLVA